jgi:hypothetical protein
MISSTLPRTARFLANGLVFWGKVIAIDHADDFPTEVCSDKQWMKTNLMVKNTATMRLWTLKGIA